MWAHKNGSDMDDVPDLSLFLIFYIVDMYDFPGGGSDWRAGL